MKNELINLEEEFEILQDEIKRTAVYFTGCATLSEDILQDVFLELSKNISKFKGKSSFRTYVMAVTKNVSYKHIKSLAKQREISSNCPKTESVDSEDDSPIDSERLNRALKLVKAKHRDPLLLKEMEGYSYNEIASILNIRVGTVKFRISYAKKQLVKILNKSTGV